MIYVPLFVVLIDQTQFETDDVPALKQGSKRIDYGKKDCP